MNPYDRRAVRALWSRVRPDRDVFAPGPWPGPPPVGQGGKPPGERPPVLRPPEPPPPPELPSERPEQLALDALIQLAAGYDCLARRLRAPTLRRLAAQCRRNAVQLRECAGLRPHPAEPERAGVSVQREREQALRGHLEAVSPACARIAGAMARDSRARTRMLSGLR